MPNHIKNKIELSGNNEDIGELKLHMIGYPWKEKPEEESIFDFNQIVLMPDELNITADGWISLLENQFSWNDSLKSELDRVRDREGFKYDKHLEETINNFAQGIKNYLKHGHASWHGWSTANWGTKWGAYSVDENWVDNSIEFETAWSNVFELMKKLSSMFPKVEIKYLYSDEDSGCNCGKAVLKDGAGDLEILENESPEAWEVYFYLRPEDKDLFEFVDGEYQYIDE